MKRNSKKSDEDLPRLQKVLAAGGLGSRRQCEDFIVEGRVEVDREVVTELGTRVDPDRQTIRVDGVPLKVQRPRYFAVHKPPGVVSTSKDQWRRARVIDLVDAKQRLFTIGRLDKESSGLILVTNDGNLANRLTHPRFHVPKTYQVTVAGSPSRDVIQRLRRGVVLSDGRVKPESVTVKKRLKQSTVLEIILTEGRNREIRRMLARLEHKVIKLHRTAFGSIRLGMLPKGAHRELTRDELEKLATSSSQPIRRQRPSRSAGSPRRVAKKKAGKPAKRGASKPATQKWGAVIGGSKPEKKSARKSKPIGRKAAKTKAKTKRG